MRFFAAWVLMWGYLFVGPLFAQSNLYQTDHISEIRLYFEESNWDYILDSLFLEGDKDRLEGKVIIDGVELDGVGVRYKGFSSFSVDRKKNPFNIKLNYRYSGQRYQGFDKIKLSNVIQDPSFIREVLSYEIARKYMPASRAGFANVYVNNVLIGLYSNVEAVNNEFTMTQFGTENHPFFKCNPEDLDLDGENSNLGNSFGTDSLDYVPYYDLESDYGWSELYNLIEILNEQPDSIQEILNVDHTLWMHAFNYALINFDSYVGYAQNYYLYQDDNGQFIPILWDLNMSFGSFRFSDASDYWDGFEVDQAPFMDPLAHYNSFSVSPRPLMTVLFENETWRKMYLAHIRTIMEENFANGHYYQRGMELQSLIDSAVLADTNKFYSYEAFQANLTDEVSDLISYPGIAQLMDARMAYFLSYPGYLGAPELQNVTDTTEVVASVPLSINVAVSNASSVSLFYRTTSDKMFTRVEMKDDGSEDDGAAGDGTFGFILPKSGNYVEYYFFAENDSAGRFLPERASIEFYSVSVPLQPGELVINELMAANSGVYADEKGDFDDWVELYNNSSFPISTKGVFLTDRLDLGTNWELPELVLDPGQYIIVWADEGKGEFHADFKLNREGDSLFLLEGESILDSVIFKDQYPIVSLGRFPNGTGDFMKMRPTPNQDNSDEQVLALTQSLFVYPNPTDEACFIIVDFPTPYEIELLDGAGRSVLNKVETHYQGYIELNTQEFASGLYYLRILSGDIVATEKILILH